MKVVLMWAVLSVVCFASASFANEPYCREYTETVTVAGKKQQGYGTACMQEDGSWKVMSQALEPETNTVSDWNPPAQPVQYVVQKEPVPVYVPAPPIYRHSGWDWVDDSYHSTSIVIGSSRPWYGYGRHRAGCRDRWHHWH